MTSGDVIDICQTVMLVWLGTIVWRQHRQLSKAGALLDDLIAQWESPPRGN